jgi:CheY-like chemotaxis protein
MLLIVDDEPDLQAVLLELLAALNGHTGIAASNRREALQLLRTRSTLPRVILLDMMMPVLDGWGFLPERRKDPRLALIPVIVISATPGIERRAEAAGATTVLRKPFNPDVLLSAVDRCLSAG